MCCKGRGIDMKNTIKTVSLILAALMLAALSGCIPRKPAWSANGTAAPTAAAQETEQAATQAPTEAPTEVPTEAPTQAPTEAPVPEVMIPQVFAGHERTFVLYPDGALYGWGINEYGQIGCGTSDNVTSPELIMEDCERVFICPFNTFAIKKDGTLWGWGWNLYGGLGIKSDDIVSSPVMLRNDVKEVISGWYNVMFLTNDGTILQTYDAEGPGGDTKVRMENVAVVHDRHVVTTNGELVVLYYNDNVLIDTGVKDVFPYCEATPFAYLKTNGELWFCDCPESIYDPHNRLLGEDVERVWNLTGDYDEEYDFLALKKDGSLYEYFESNYEPCFEKKLFDSAADVSFAHTYYGFSSRIHVFVLLENGNVYFRGEADAASGLMKGKKADKFVKVDQDAAFVSTNGVGSFIISRDDSLWGCGVVIKGFKTGGIGDGTYEDVWGFKKILSGVCSFTQLTRSWIEEDDSDSDEPNDTSMASTRYAVLRDGSVWAWGSGKYCSIGNGETKRADEPVKILEPRFK